MPARKIWKKEKAPPASDMHWCEKMRNRYFAKACATWNKIFVGAFQNFLAHHPHLFKPPGYDEVHFFDKEDDYAKGIEYYHSLMPETSAGEITYEKTPKYMVIPEVPGRIYAMNNTVKLIAIVCNPVNRAFSDFTHVVKSGYFKSVRINPETSSLPWKWESHWD